MAVPHPQFGKPTKYLGNLKDSKKWLSKKYKDSTPVRFSPKVSTLFQQVDCPKIHRFHGVKFSPKVSTLFHKMVVQKCQDSTPLKFRPKILALFQTHFWVSRIYLCFNIFVWFSDFQCLSRFHHRQFLWKRSEIPIVLDPPDFKTKLQNVWCPVGSDIWIFLEFRKVEICRNSIC